MLQHVPTKFESTVNERNVGEVVRAILCKIRIPPTVLKFSYRKRDEFFLTDNYR